MYRYIIAHIVSIILWVIGFNLLWYWFGFKLIIPLALIKWSDEIDKNLLEEEEKAKTLLQRLKRKKY